MNHNQKSPTILVLYYIQPRCNLTTKARGGMIRQRSEKWNPKATIEGRIKGGGKQLTKDMTEQEEGNEEPSVTITSASSQNNWCQHLISSNQ